MIEVTIKDVESSIKKALENYDVLNTKSVYEKIEDSDDLKLVVFINKLFGKNVILYTKLIFKVDKDKTKLTDNSFLYLYDINCKYVNVKFSDIFDLEKKLKDIFNKNKFGSDIKTLSDFVEKPAFLINDWLNKNKINNINVSNVRYDPKSYMVPCKLLSFSFSMSVNNIDIPFSISKEKDLEYVLSIRINDKVVDIEMYNLDKLVQYICVVLKNNFK